MRVAFSALRLPATVLASRRLFAAPRGKPQERDALARELDKNRNELAAAKEEGLAARKQRDLLQAELASTRAAYVEHLDARRQIDELRQQVEEGKQALQVAAGERDAAVLTRDLAQREADARVEAAVAEAGAATARVDGLREEARAAQAALEEMARRHGEAEERARAAEEARAEALAAQAAAEAHTRAAQHDVQAEQEARARVEQEALDYRSQVAEAVRKQRAPAARPLPLLPLCALWNKRVDVSTTG